MNKKGNLVTMLITTIILVLLISSFLIPYVKRATSAQDYGERLIRDEAPNEENVTLSKAADGLELKSNSLTISGLTAGTNYSVNYTSGVVTFKNVTVNGTYPASYSYYEAEYLTNRTERVMFAVISLAVLIGTLYVVLGPLATSQL